MVTTSIADSLDETDTRFVRGLLDRAFEGRFTDDDWVHATGGHHIIVSSDGILVAHAAIVARDIGVGRGVHMVGYTVGYVEAVATEPAVQRRGHGTAAMRAVGRIIREHHDFGLLSTGAHGFYERLGWQPWRGPTRMRRADGTITRTPEDDGGIMVLTSDASPQLDRDAAITCGDRVGDCW